MLRKRHHRQGLLFLLFIAWAGIAFNAAAEEKAAESKAVATVNGSTITLGDFNRTVKAMEGRTSQPGQAGGGAPDRSKMEQQALDNLIKMELLYQEAKRVGITVSDDEIASNLETLRKRFTLQEAFDTWLKRNGLTEDLVKEQMRRGLMIKKFTLEKIMPKITIRDEELKTFYDNNQNAFREPEQVHAAHILVKVDPKADEKQKAEARKRIEEILKRVQAGADFRALAQEVSDSPDKEKGGDLGYFRRGQMVKPFEDAAFKLKPGEVSDVVETQFGYHIIKVFERRPEGMPTYVEVKDRIELMFRQERLQAEVNREAENLRKQAKVEIFQNREGK
jgi:peptidyl-prolyl cis-trans isomerase C